jgi:putative peptidoglycan lipid II flippase
MLGFARDIINARVLGAGLISDAFFVAFRLPNLFRSLFAEGAMNAAFIPIYSKKLHNQEKDADQFAGKIIFITSVFLMIFCTLAEVFMPLLIKLIAPGFEEDNQYFGICIAVSRIMFPFLFFITITAIYGCIIQSHGKFGPTASYPIIMNLVLIAASFVPISIPIYNLSVGVVISGILQMIFLIWSAKYYGISIRFSNILSKKDGNNEIFNHDVRNFFKKLGPSIITSCVTRIGITIDTMIASTTVGAVSYIYYADRLYQLPLSLIGVALANVLLSPLSKFVAQISNIVGETQEKDELKTRLYLIKEKVFEFSLILVIPASIGLFMLADDICLMMFQNKSGNFSRDSIDAVAQFLRLVCIALPANILNNVFNAILFANHITKFTTKAAFLSLILNLVVNFTLFFVLDFGYKSVAVATFISSYFNLLLLFFCCKKHNFLPKIKNFDRLMRIFYANLLLIIFIFSFSFFIQKFGLQSVLLQNLLLICNIFLSIIVYFFILSWNKKFKLSDFRGIFR